MRGGGGMRGVVCCALHRELLHRIVHKICIMS